MRTARIRSRRALAALAFAAVAAGCNPATPDSAKAAPAAPLSVPVTQARRGPITRSISLPANVRALRQATLYAKVAGYLKTIGVDRGDKVEAGEVLAEIEAPELLADAAKHEAEVAATQADHRRLAEASKRAPDLVVPLAVETAKGKYEMALAGARRNQTLLGFTRIVAPFSGVVTRRWADVGALIPAATGNSTPAGAAVVTLADFSRVRVEVSVPEPEVPLLKAGLAAEVKVDELPGKAFSGQVTRIAWSLDEATRTMPVEIELANPDDALRPGMFATAKIAVSQKPDALLLPTDALVVEKAKTSVFALVDGKAKKVPVKVGFEDGKSFEVLEGIAAEAVVILTGKLPLADGQPINRAEGR
jgi:membrane fusion protein (multidrug efflux system)